MNTHNFKLSPLQQKKLLKGLSVQIKPTDLNGDVELDISKPMKTKVNRAIRMGKGLRLKLNKEQIGHNLFARPNLRVHATHQILNELDGGKINIGKAFKKFGNQIVKSAKTVGNFLDNNKKGILKTAVQIIAPVALKTIAQKTGIPVDAATKAIVDASVKGIDKSPALKNRNKKSKQNLSNIANLPKPINIVDAQPVEPITAEPIDTNTNVEGMGIRRRGRKPKIGGAIAIASHAKLLGSKTMIKQGGALYPSGGALYPAGGALYPAGGALYPSGYVAPRF